MTPAEGHTDTHAAWWWFVIPPGLTVAGALLEHWANARQMHRHWALQRFAGGDAIQAMYRTLVVRPLLAAARLVAHWLEPGMARWTLGKFALLLDRTDGAQLKSSTSQATLYGPHRALLLSVIAVVVVLAFLLLTAFSRMR